MGFNWRHARKATDWDKNRSIQHKRPKQLVVLLYSMAILIDVFFDSPMDPYTLYLNSLARRRQRQQIGALRSPLSFLVAEIFVDACKNSTNYTPASMPLMAWPRPAIESPRAS